MRHLDDERATLVGLAEGVDFTEGVDAYREKRKPIFIRKVTGCRKWGEDRCPAQLKKIAFLVPREGLSRDQFMRYWARDLTAPLVAGSPGYGEYRQKYVQNHFLGADPIGQPFDYAGMAEFWLPGDNEDTFATTPIYRERIKIDEMNFINMDGTVSMTAVEETIQPGTGTVKLVVIRRGVPKAEAKLAGKAGQLRGAYLNHVIKDSFRLPGARPVQGAIECIEEYWFDSETDAQMALSTVDRDPGCSAFSPRNMYSSRTVDRCRRMAHRMTKNR